MRASKRGSLLNIKQLGLNPQLVIDVGARIGTHEVYEVCPESAHLLIEPVREHEPALQAYYQIHFRSNLDSKRDKQGES